MKLNLLEISYQAAREPISGLGQFETPAVLNSSSAKWGIPEINHQKADIAASMSQAGGKAEVVRERCEVALRP